MESWLEIGKSGYVVVPGRLLRGHGNHPAMWMLPPGRVSSNTFKFRILGREFPGSAAVVTPHFHWGHPGSIPRQGTGIPKAAPPCGQKKKEKEIREKTQVLHLSSYVDFNLLLLIRKLLIECGEKMYLDSDVFRLLVWPIRELPYIILPWVSFIHSFIHSSIPGHLVQGNFGILILLLQDGEEKSGNASCKFEIKFKKR